MAYLAQLIVVVLPIWLSCDVSVEDAVYGTICAYAMQHFSSSLYILLCLGTGAGHDIWRLLDPATLGYYLLAYVPPISLSTDCAPGRWAGMAATGPACFGPVGSRCWCFRWRCS